jgi:hypothetical protein
MADGLTGVSIWRLFRGVRNILHYEIRWMERSCTSGDRRTEGFMGLLIVVVDDEQRAGGGKGRGGGERGRGANGVEVSP